MDGKMFQDVASSIVKLKMYPYFDITHYLLMCMAVRDDTPQTGSQAFSRKHPFACWLASMMMCFAGSILANFLIGEPVLTFLKHEDSLALASLVWYLVNYSPFDLVYRVARFTPVKFIICIMKEFQRTKKVYDGVTVAHRLFPDSHLVVLVIGVVKGSGSSLCIVLIRLFYGVFIPAKNEALYPQFTTKACLAVSGTFLLEKLGRIQAPHEQIYLGALMFLVYFKMSALIMGIHDPFRPFENIFCAVFLGGLVDAMRRATDKRAATPAGSPSTYSSNSTSSGGGGSGLDTSGGGDSGAANSTENGRPPGLNKSREEKKNE